MAPAITHIVMWDVRGDSPQARADAARQVVEQFESLRGRIPGMRRLELGIDTSRVEYACDVVLVSEFESQRALDDYAVHPEHLRVRRALGDLRIARHQVDYPTPTPRTEAPQHETSSQDEPR